MNDRRRMVWFVGLFAALAFAFTACGGNGNGDGDGNGNGDQDTGMPTGDTTNGGGMDTGGTTEDTDNGGGGGSAKTGNIQLNQTRASAAGMTIVQWTGSASFSETTGDSAGSSCESTEMGACSIIRCENTDGEGETNYRSAGEITISGGAQEVTMTQGSSGTYTANGMGEVWNNSHTLTVDAAGDVVPSFSTDISPASQATLTAPELPPVGMAMTIDTSSDLALEWETGDIDSGQFLVQLSSSNDSESSILTCDWDATAGSASVPASILGEMITGDGAYQFGVGAVSETTAGDYAVTVQTTEIVDDGDSATASGTGQATFE